VRPSRRSAACKRQTRPTHQYAARYFARGEEGRSVFAMRFAMTAVSSTNTRRRTWRIVATLAKRPVAQSRGTSGSGNVGLGERRARGTSGSGNVGLGERRARGTSGSGNVRSDCLAMIDRYLPLRAGSQPGADRRDGHARRMPKVEAQGAHRGRWSAFTRTRLKAVDVSAASFAPFLIFGTANTTCEGTIFSQGCNTTVQS
jgi:hypothetical protein